MTTPPAIALPWCAICRHDGPEDLRPAQDGELQVVTDDGWRLFIPPEGQYVCISGLDCMRRRREDGDD